MSVRNNYTMINIREYLALGTDEEVGEPALVRLLSDFSCPKNPDVEYFLKKNAIEFTKKNQSVTYLVFSNNEGELIGYFSIALKPLTVRCRTDFADIQNKKECGGNRQWQNHYLRNWAANTKGKGII